MKMHVAFLSFFVFTAANHVVEIFRDQCKRACCQCFIKDENNLDCHEKIAQSCEKNLPDKNVCESEFSEARKAYEDAQCPQCAHCKYCDVHNEEPSFYDYENPGDDYFYYYHGKDSVLNGRPKGDFMKLCADWNVQPSRVISPTTEPSSTTVRSTTRGTTATTKRATTRMTKMISTMKLAENTIFEFSKSFNISKSRSDNENCSKFCEQRFLQSKFSEFALKWAKLAKVEKSMRNGKVKRKTTTIRKAINHRERNFKCRSDDLIPAKIFNVKCCEKLSIDGQDEKETIKMLCSSIVKFYEFTDENCEQKTWISRLKRFCDRLISE